MSRLFDEAVQSAPEVYKQALIAVFDTADMARRWLDDNKMERDPFFIAKMTEQVLKIATIRPKAEEYWSFPNDLPYDEINE